MLLIVAGAQVQAQTATVAKPDSAAPAGKDTITLPSGNVLTGKVRHLEFGTLTFHSDELRTMTIPLAKVKTMRTTTAFAVASTTQNLTRKNVARQVSVGKIIIENGTLKVMGPSGVVKEFPEKDLSFMLSKPAWKRELHNQSNFFYGWYGTITLGATVVNSTRSTSHTYTGDVHLVRAIPTIAGLPAGSKTILNLSGTYGLARSPKIVSGGNVIQGASESKTNILHGDLEHDKFFTAMVFGLVNSSADHNFGDGLQLQQSYGAGIGWGILRTPRNDLAARISLHYEQQQFYAGITSGLGTPTENLVGATVGETWKRKLPGNLKFNEDVMLSPAFNVVQAYSAAATARLTSPIYKNLNFSVRMNDNYLGDPPEGFLRNTYQLTAGVTYTLQQF